MLEGAGDGSATDERQATNGGLESLLEGVEAAVGQARRQAAGAQEQADRWQQEFERERQARQQLEQQLEMLQAQVPEDRPNGAAAAAASPYDTLLTPPPERTVSLHSAVVLASAAGVHRRHTAPALRTAATALGSPELLDQLSSTASRLETLRQELERDLEAGKAADGSLALSRLSSLLHACSFLRNASAAACSSRRGSADAAEDDMYRQDSAGGTGQQEVALHDDGAAGVGATAAAAVSVALAQSWAAAAGARQASFRLAEGAVRPGKARFKLVAAVPRSYRSRRERLTASASRASVADGSVTPLGALAKSSSGLSTMGDAEPDTMDDAQEATWRASGQHLKLQWLTAPTSVLVVYKPVPAVLVNAAKAVAWLLQRGLTVWVEPDAWEELCPAVEEYLSASTRNPGDSGGMPPAARAGISRLANGDADASVSLDSQDDEGSPDSHGISPSGPGLPPLPPRPAANVRQQLCTWDAPPCGCPPAVPKEVAHQLDLVITLGGDGTVLWTCGLFRTGAVPPLVPLAMGSLGFMTPFNIQGQMESVLSRVISLDRGMPLMLRHRLQCRIMRGDSSSSDLTSTPAPACLEEFVVLNEMVIDRGMTAQLCNLQCFVDNSHVTVVQGDGLIVATPTGSTAYNLAAGGSMVHPAVPCFLFTPICPHSLSSRPLVLPEHVVLRVKVPLDSRGSAYCSFDGRSRQELRPGDSVLIAMSQWPAPMVCNLDSSHDWFLSMREGLCWNMRKQQAGRGQ